MIKIIVIVFTAMITFLSYNFCCILCLALPRVNNAIETDSCQLLHFLCSLLICVHVKKDLQRSNCFIFCSLSIPNETKTIFMYYTMDEDIDTKERYLYIRNLISSSHYKLM